MIAKYGFCDSAAATMAMDGDGYIGPELEPKVDRLWR